MILSTLTKYGPRPTATLAAAKQGVYSQEYTARGIPRALLVGLLIEVLGLHLMDPGMDRRAAVLSALVGGGDTVEHDLGIP